MSEYVFLFDLDSTITRAEILPELAKHIGKETDMRFLTDKSMCENNDFVGSFLKRANMLKDIPISLASRLVGNIDLNETLVTFIQNNKERCYIVTGNLDVWISELMNRLGMQFRCFCSTTTTKDETLISINSVCDKGLVAKQFVVPFVAIGDGSNDVPMAKLSKTAIGFGGVRNISPLLEEICDYKVYDEHELNNLLVSLL